MWKSQKEQKASADRERNRAWRTDTWDLRCCSYQFRLSYTLLKYLNLEKEWSTKLSLVSRYVRNYLVIKFAKKPVQETEIDWNFWFLNAERRIPTVGERPPCFSVCQYWYFCTSKASKLLRETICTSKASKSLQETITRFTSTWHFRVTFRHCSMSFACCLWFIASKDRILNQTDLQVLFCLLFLFSFPWGLKSRRAQKYGMCDDLVLYPSSPKGR
jgi:hypothetical protein